MSINRGSARAWLRALKDFVYPPLCLLCESALEEGEDRVCRCCWRTLPRLFPADLAAAELNPAFCFDCSLAVFDYQAPVQTLIHAFKYRGFRVLARPLAQEAAKVAAEPLRIWQADALVPVPLHPARRRERGYNQAGLLAEELGKALSLPVYPAAIRRTRYTPPQAQRSRSQRRQNILSAFRPGRQSPVVGKRIVLVDDILTTGYTANACAQVLLEVGAARIVVLSIARAG